MKNKIVVKSVVALALLLIIAGMIFLALSLSTHIKNERENKAAVENAQKVMSALRPMISAAVTDEPEDTTDTTNSPDNPSSPNDAPAPSEMTTITVDGYDYIGYITIPALDLELPVMSEWDYDRLKLVPCRHAGTLADENLVIAGHNFDDTFGRLTLLTVGSDVYFTDVCGTTHSFTVSFLETIHGDNVSLMLDSNPGLTLYTCTYSGEDRFTVRCTPTAE